MKSSLSISSIIVWYQKHESMNLLLKPRSWRFTPMFFSKSVMVLAVTFRTGLSWVNFCIWYEIGVQIHPFPYGYPIFPAPFVEKTFLSPIERSWYPPLSKINWPYMYGSISGLSILCYCSIGLSLCQYHTFLISVDLKFWNWEMWVLWVCYSFFQDYFGYWSPLQFLMNLRINYTISEKKGHWNFDRNFTESVGHFE